MDSDESRVWVARTCAGLDIWLGWLAVVLHLNLTGVSPCSPPKTGEGVMLKEQDVKAQTGHSDLFARGVKSPGYFFIAARKVSAHLHVTPGSQLYVYYGSPQNKVLKNGFVMKEVETMQSFASVRHGYVQHVAGQWSGEHFV